jgi:hypothetical protein
MFESYTKPNQSFSHLHYILLNDLGLEEILRREDIDERDNDILKGTNLASFWKDRESPHLPVLNN